MELPSIKGKRVLITGVCGTVGTELLRQLLETGEYSPAEVIGIDNSESNLFFLDQTYINEPRVNLSVTDVRDLDSVRRKMEGIDLVFHTAALKHVILSERSPEQAIQTNIFGVQNVIEAASSCNVGKVIFTSSDKAVNPTNVMGTSKLMGERLMTAANSNRRACNTIFSSTRFGNVLGSNGSVIPIFKKQIASGGPITLTDNEMTRFVMSIEESVRLVIDSANLEKGGEIFVTKMPVVRIADLAEAMIRLLAPVYGIDEGDIKTKIIGSKPGEKLYEELMSDEETRRSVELDQYFSVLPAFRGIYHDIDYSYDSITSTKVTNPYVSSIEKGLSVENIMQLLRDYNLVDSFDDGETERYWPGDKEETISRQELENPSESIVN